MVEISQYGSGEGSGRVTSRPTLHHVGIFGVPQRTLDASRLFGIAIFIIGIWLVR